MEIQFYIHPKSNRTRLRSKPSVYMGGGSIQLYTGKIFGFAAGLNIYNKVQKI
jgi:hypothetical protein